MPLELPMIERMRARKQAKRMAWLATQNARSLQEALDRFEASVRSEPMAEGEYGSIWITIVLQIGFALIKWWWENRDSRGRFRRLPRNWQERFDAV